MSRKKKIIKNENVNKGGRESQYEIKVKPNLTLIEDWRNQGCSEDMIALKLGVGKSTFQAYKTRYEDLKEVLRNSKRLLGAKIKKQLYKECLGYEYEETHEEARVEPVIDENGKVNNVVKEIKRKRIKKWHRPQQNLIIFALCNLLPEEFQRVDREIIENLGDELEKRVFSSENIKKAFLALYPEEKTKEKLEENKKDV